MTDDTLVMERSFDAPRALIWRMWTDPEHFAAWYGPEGASIPVAKLDVRPGGTRLVGMEVQTPGGPVQMWFTGEYREVREPERLVYTEAICDEDGTVLSPSEATEVRVELDEVDGRTRMVLTHVGVAGDSPGAAGWAMALDKLAAYAATA